MPPGFLCPATPLNLSVLPLEEHAEHDVSRPVLAYGLCHLRIDSIKVRVGKLPAFQPGQLADCIGCVPLDNAAASGSTPRLEIEDGVKVGKLSPAAK